MFEIVGKRYRHEGISSIIRHTNDFVRIFATCGNTFRGWVFSSCVSNVLPKYCWEKLGYFTQCFWFFTSNNRLVIDQLANISGLILTGMFTFWCEKHKKSLASKNAVCENSMSFWDRKSQLKSLPPHSTANCEN